jgi:hypothetical protein
MTLIKLLWEGLIFLVKVMRHKCQYSPILSTCPKSLHWARKHTVQKQGVGEAWSPNGINWHQLASTGKRTGRKRTGKSEIMASILAIALNNSMQEYTDKEETHQEPTNQPAEAPTGVGDDDAPQQCM